MMVTMLPGGAVPRTVGCISFTEAFSVGLSMVTPAGVALVSALTLPSPSAPTNVFGENRKEMGEVVAASVVNLMVATVPVPVIGVVVLVAPRAIEIAPLPTVP